MTEAWTSDDLRAIAAARELEIQSLRPDGTLRKSVTIWVVRQDDDLYVRSWRGPGSAWFRGVHDRHEGHDPSGQRRQGRDIRRDARKARRYLVRLGRQPAGQPVQAKRCGLRCARPLVLAATCYGARSPRR